MEIKTIIDNTERYNFHSHTEFCDGRAPMSDMADAADAAGFDVWGYSPHAPISVPSPCNMNHDDVAAYKQGVEDTRRRHPDMRIFAGMEVDYIDADHGPSSAAVQEYGLDYVIGSVHFVPDREGTPYDIDGHPERFRERLATVFKGDLDYVVRTFWQQTMQMIQRGGMDIVGHIDKIARNASTVRPLLEQEPEYRKLADAAVDAAIAGGFAIEINTKQRVSARRYFPHPRFWARIARVGVPMPVNSDAHTTEGVDASRTDARRLLRAIVALDTTPGATLAVVTDDDRLLTYSNRGVRDLYTLLTDSPEVLAGATVADRVIGRGAAALMSAGRVSQVYTNVISKAALETFALAPDIMVDYDRVVDYIINRAGTGVCPVETATAGLPDPKDAVGAIAAFLAKNS